MGRIWLRYVLFAMIPLALVLGLVGTLALGAYLDRPRGAPATEPTVPGSAGGATGEVVVVERVIDGDTFVVRGGTHVRLIGVDTPEPRGDECYASEATAETARALRPGLTVTLKWETDGGKVDVRQRARLDRYGRTLAYVYLTDGSFLNLKLVAGGFARARYFAPNDDHRVEFEAAQAGAKRSARGGWGACGW
jgi:micrococcal nuclease